MRRIFAFLSFFFLSVFYKVNSAQAQQLSNPLQTDSPQVFIGQVINATLGIVGSLALLMFVYGGFTWMIASGNAEKVEKGKNILFWATAGLVIIFTSYAIVNFVIFEFIGAE